MLNTEFNFVKEPTGEITLHFNGKPSKTYKRLAFCLDVLQKDHIFIRTFGEENEVQMYMNKCAKIAYAFDEDISAYILNTLVIISQTDWNVETLNSIIHKQHGINQWMKKSMPWLPVAIASRKIEISFDSETEEKIELTESQIYDLSHSK